MKTRNLVLAMGIAVTVVLSVRAVSVWFSSAPSSVTSGTSYFVQATADTGGSIDLTVNKNGGSFAFNSGTSYVTAGAYTTDYGQQTVEFHAHAVDWYTYDYADAWHYVSINPPANTAPFGVCDYAHSTVPINGNLYCAGWAADNEMGAPVSRIDLLIDGNDVADTDLGGGRQDVANAYGRQDFLYSGWGINYNIGTLSVGTHTLELRAWDNQGASTNFGYRTFEVTNTTPNITLLSPSAQSINVGTSLTISSNATDPDGNITAHNLDIQRPDGTWNWQGGFAYGEPYMGGPVGSASNSTRSASFTFNQAGTWYVRSWVNDAYGSNQHSATVAIVVVNPNQPPSIVWSTQPPGYPNSGSTFTARATATDQDGNLSSVSVDVSVNGGAWTALAYNGGGSGSSNTSDGNLVTAGAEGTTYQFRAIAGDSGGLNSGYIFTAVSTVNRSPSVSLQVLDSTKNAFAIGGNGRAQVPINTTFYLRVAGNDPDGRMAKLYARYIPVGGSEVDVDVAASGSSATHDFGPFNSGGTAGLVDAWAHASDADAGGYTWQGSGWSGTNGPDIDVIKLTPAPVIITSGIRMPRRRSNCQLQWRIPSDRGLVG